MEKTDRQLGIETEAEAYFDALFEFFYEARREGKSWAADSIDTELLYLKDAARQYYENDLTATKRFPLRHEVGRSLFEK